jgi:hypothetical protein
VVSKVRELVPKETLVPDRVVGVNQIIAEAVGMKFLAAPLTPEQVKELIQILQQDPRRLARIELVVLSRG